VRRLICGALLAAGLSAAELQRDIEFAQVPAADGSKISLKLDISIPEGKGPFPTAIIVHGGGWEGGDKAIEWVQPLFKPLSDAGFVWISINYRLSPQAPYPSMYQDVMTAIQWVDAHAKQYKVDRKRLALIGESAGGHLVALAGTRGKGPAKVAAVVDFYGPHDLVKQIAERDQGDYTAMAKRMFRSTPQPDTEARLREASPIHYVHKGMPPFLFIHGTLDKSVPFNQSPLMCDKMKSVGVACEVIPMEGAPHGMSNWEKNPAWTTYKQPMIAWLKKTLR
jgi:alpha-L-fucosidase 2